MTADFIKCFPRENEQGLRGKMLWQSETAIGCSQAMRYKDEIPLDAEMLYALSRRARRRLRDLEVSTQTVLQIDRQRRLLCIQGSYEGIAEVRRFSGSSVNSTLLGDRINNLPR